MSLTPIQNFYRETIAQDWPTGTGNFYVSTAPTVSTGYLTISPASTTLREIVYFTATGTDGTGPFVTISTGGRGKGGTTEQTHVIGEPIRMNVTAETIDEISDQLDSIVAAGAPDATTSVKGIAKLPRIVYSTSATYSPVTVASEMLILMVKGNIDIPGTTDPSTVTVNMKINGSTVDTIVSSANTNSGTTQKHPISFLYFATPGAQTNAITFDVTISNLKIISIII